MVTVRGVKLPGIKFTGGRKVGFGFKSQGPFVEWAPRPFASDFEPYLH